MVEQKRHTSRLGRCPSRLIRKLDILCTVMAQYLEHSILIAANALLLYICIVHNKAYPYARQTGKNTCSRRCQRPLVFASCTRHPLRNAVIVLLSAKAGLRAGEIANLTWDMVVDATGAAQRPARAARQRGQERQRSLHPRSSRSRCRPGGMAAGCTAMLTMSSRRSAAARMTPSASSCGSTGRSRTLA